MFSDFKLRTESFSSTELATEYMGYLISFSCDADVLFGTSFSRKNGSLTLSSDCSPLILMAVEVYFELSMVLSDSPNVLEKLSSAILFSFFCPQYL